MGLASRVFKRKQSLETEIKEIFAKCTFGAPASAEATWETTTPVVLTSVATGDERNGTTATLQVAAAAANPTDTVLAAFTGSAAAIVVTITPNNGTNNPVDAAEAVLDLTADVTLTSVAVGAARNTNTFTLQVAAAAANPSDTVLAAFTGTAAAIVCTVTPNNGVNNPNAAATGVLDLTADVTLTSVAAGTGRNTNTFTLQVAAPAPNPTDTVLAAFTGTAAAIVCTITPNDGTNNAATPVDLTTAELAELISTGLVAGKTVTITDASSLRNDQTASGGGATPLADGGEGDGVVATFSGGTDTPVSITTAELAELINSGVVVGKTVTVTDASSLRNDQTAAGGGATPLADAGEGDGVVGTFSGGTNPAVQLTTAELAELITSGSVAGKTVTVTDASSLRALQTATGGDTDPLADAGEGDGLVATFAGGDDSVVDNSVLGVASFERNSPGVYQMTLEDGYQLLKSFSAILQHSSAEDIRIQLVSEAVSGSKIIVFRTLTGATPTDPSSGAIMYFKLELKNSSVAV